MKFSSVELKSKYMIVTTKAFTLKSRLKTADIFYFLISVTN